VDSVFLYEKHPVKQSNEVATKLATKYCAVFMICDSPLKTVTGDREHRPCRPPPS